MAITPDEELEVTIDELDGLAATAAAMADAASGWVNLIPEVESGHEPPPRSIVATVFSARGEAIPHATWSAPEQPGRRTKLGIEHGSGPKALARLDEVGLGLRPGWLKVADHPRRGLVVTAPPDEQAVEALRWLLDAATALSVPPLTGSWLARVYRPPSR